MQYCRFAILNIVLIPALQHNGGSGGRSGCSLQAFHHDGGSPGQTEAPGLRGGVQQPDEDAASQQVVPSHAFKQTL